MSHKIPIEVRNLVMERIKVDGINANCAATEAGLSPKTVYGWLAKETHKSGVSWAEHNKLKRENKQLKEIIGHITLGMQQTKKN